MTGGPHCCCGDGGRSHHCCAADLYSSRDKESHQVSRPKTPLLDTRHWQQQSSSTSSEPGAPHDPAGARAPFQWRGQDPGTGVPLRTAYSAALDKTTANPSWYTTLGKLRDTYWSENGAPPPKERTRSGDYGGGHHPQSASKGGGSSKGGLNDSYEDSVFLSSQSWSSGRPDGDWSQPPHPTGYSQQPSDSSYPRSNSVRSMSNGGQLYGQQHSNGGSVHHPHNNNGDHLSFRSSHSQDSNCGSLQRSRGADWVDLVVTLVRQESGYGFHIVGGAEEGSQVSVGRLVPGGAAELDGRVQTGDEIVSVEGAPVLSTSRHRVVQMVRGAAPTVTLWLRAPNTTGCILEGSPAELCGRLRVGDRILRVNGASILHLHHGETVNLIKESGRQITLTIHEHCCCGGGHRGRAGIRGQQQGGGDALRPDGDDQVRRDLPPGVSAGHLLRELRCGRPHHHLLRGEEQEDSGGVRAHREEHGAARAGDAERPAHAGAADRGGGAPHAQRQGATGQLSSAGGCAQDLHWGVAPCTTHRLHSLLRSALLWGEIFFGCLGRKWSPIVEKKTRSAHR